MSNSGKRNNKDHLAYAAVHQKRGGYLIAVGIHNLTSIIKLCIVGAIIYVSKNEIHPILVELIKRISL